MYQYEHPLLISLLSRLLLVAVCTRKGLVYGGHGENRALSLQMAGWMPLRKSSRIDAESFSGIASQDANGMGRAFRHCPRLVASNGMDRCNAPSRGTVSAQDSLRVASRQEVNEHKCRGLQREDEVCHCGVPDNPWPD